MTLPRAPPLSATVTGYGEFGSPICSTSPVQPPMKAAGTEAGPGSALVVGCADGVVSAARTVAAAGVLTAGGDPALASPVTEREHPERATITRAASTTPRDRRSASRADGDRRTAAWRERCTIPPIPLCTVTQHWCAGAGG